MERERKREREREVTVVVCNCILTSSQSYIIFLWGSTQDNRAERDIRKSEEEKEESGKLTKKSLTYDFFSNKKIVSA